MYANRSTDNRIGQPWSNEEDRQLLEEIGSKLDISTIASAHQRTVKGIKLRLIHNAVQAVEKGLFDAEKACQHFGISRLDIEEYNAKKAKKVRADTFKDKQPEYHEKYLGLLTEIRDSLKILTEHICMSASASSFIPAITTPSLSSPVSSASSVPSSPLRPPVKIIKKNSLNPIRSTDSLPSLVQQQQQQQEQFPDSVALKVNLPKLKVDVQ
jgi:hypothetical protein